MRKMTREGKEDEKRWVWEYAVKRVQW